MGREHRHAGSCEVMSRRIAALNHLRSARHVRDYAENEDRRRLGRAALKGAIGILAVMDIDFDPVGLARSEAGQALRELVMS